MTDIVELYHVTKFPTMHVIPSSAEQAEEYTGESSSLIHVVFVINIHASTQHVADAA